MLMTTAKPKPILEPADRPSTTCIVRGLQQCKACKLIRTLTTDQYNGTQKPSKAHNCRVLNMMNLSVSNNQYRNSIYWMERGALNAEIDSAMKTCTEYSLFQCAEFGTRWTRHIAIILYLLAQQGIGHFLYCINFLLK